MKKLSAKAMIENAIALALKAKKGEKYNETLHKAAEWGWLAASSTADVVAKRLRLPIPEGMGKRKDTMEELDALFRTKGHYFSNLLTFAHKELHSRAFHGNERTQKEVLFALSGVEVMVDEALRLTENYRKHR